MMFLFLQLVFWLLIAGVLGFAAGWFLQARRAGKKLAEHRERYRQHIKRLEQGLADAEEQQPYAKETRDAIDVSDNPVSFLSGAEEAEARRRSKLADDASPASAETSGLQTAKTVTLASLQDEPEANGEPDLSREDQLDESRAEAVAENLADESNAGFSSAPSAWDDRLQSCENEISTLRQRLGRLEQQCRQSASAAQPPAQAAAMAVANQTASAPSAGMASAIKSYAMPAPDGEPDDLKRIWGVGPKLEGMLNDLGIFHYRQIAAFSAEDVEAVSAALDQFSDRVKRDDWITQARKLMAETD